MGAFVRSSCCYIEHRSNVNYALSQHPSVVFHTGNVADLLVDPQTEVIIGYQIEGYLARAVYG